MYPISRILVPVDFSERCKEMIPYAALLGAKYDAEIVLLHAVNPVYSIPAAGGFGPLLVPLPASTMENLARRLEGFAADLLAGLNVRRLIYEGDPVEQVSEFAQKSDVQLIIMPTHGYGVMRRFLIGSVTAKILHDVTCAVLTSRHVTPDDGGTPKTITNVLCALDLRGPSQGILASATRLAQDLRARLSVIHVIAPLDHRVSEELTLRWRRETEAAARAEIAQLLSITEAVPADTYVQEGDVVKIISALAESIQADLVVIGRGRDETGGLKPTGYSIIRQAPCAVLSV
ncbi:MAG TPA: universal stress protein [Bryobacteraceae bacterium]|jgi:nucleotide-binding universal stress UspA family protein|nr:universal stress protein [Bryobacteraceae bacterium]